MRLKWPISGHASSFDSAVSGHATPAPPRSAMNSCRLMWDPIETHRIWKTFLRNPKRRTTPRDRHRGQRSRLSPLRDAGFICDHPDFASAMRLQKHRHIDS